MASTSYLIACDRPSLLRLLVNSSQRARAIANVVAHGVRTLRHLRALTSASPTISDANGT
jgi:hypothetical protein